jgi:hypothetical protein
VLSKRTADHVVVFYIAYGFQLPHLQGNATHQLDVLPRTGGGRFSRLHQAEHFEGLVGHQVHPPQDFTGSSIYPTLLFSEVLFFSPVQRGRDGYRNREDSYNYADPNDDPLVQELSLSDPVSGRNQSFL